MIISTGVNGLGQFHSWIRLRVNITLFILISMRHLSLFYLSAFFFFSLSHRSRSSLVLTTYVSPPPLSLPALNKLKFHSPQPFPPPVSLSSPWVSSLTLPFPPNVALISFSLSHSHPEVLTILVQWTRGSKSLELSPILVQ